MNDKRKTYTVPASEPVCYAPRVNNSYDPDDESGLVDIVNSGTEIPAELGEGKELLDDADEEELNVNLWED